MWDNIFLMSKSNPNLFGQLFRIGADYPDFKKLDAIPRFAHEAYDIVGETPWTKATTSETHSAQNHLRAGFNGGIDIVSATLVRDGEIADAEDGRIIDGLLVELEMQLLLTGRQEPIVAIGGLAVGNGNKRFEIRAYDLSTKTFGKITINGLRDYLEKSKSRAASTQDSPYKNRTRIKT